MNYNRFFIKIIFLISIITLLFTLSPMRHLENTEEYFDLLPAISSIVASLFTAISFYCFNSRLQKKESAPLNKYEISLPMGRLGKYSIEDRFMEEYRELNTLITNKYDLDSEILENPVIYQLKKYQKEGSFEMRDSLKEVICVRNMIVHGKGGELDKLSTADAFYNMEKILHDLQNH